MPKPKKLSVKNNRNLFILYSLGLILAFSGALPAYIQSNFLGQFVGVQAMSAYLILANLLSVLAILFFPGLIRKLSNYFLTKISLILYASSLLGLAISTNAALALVSIILFTISSNLIWINMDFLIEDFSIDAVTGKIRSIYFTFINIGWILSPTLAAYLLIGKGEYTLIFLIAASLTIPFFLTFLYEGRKLQDHNKYKRLSFGLAFKRMWTKPNLRGIFFVALLLQIFFNSAVIYVPLYLFQNMGMSWEVLGPIFSIMLIPFVLVEIPAGIIADRYLGEKELLITGFLILSVSLFLFYYIPVPSAWLWAAVLFLSRIGAALIEAMRETYFFKIVSVKDADDINIFRTTTPLGHTLGSLLAIGTLFFFPLQYLFLFLSIIMLSGFFFIASIKDTK
jgi:MFS family permease